MCLLWLPGLMLLHIISDGLIAVAYFAIPFGIAGFVKRRQDLERKHRVVAILFASFITLCGLTHLASILVLWFPYYVTEGWLKALTAAISIVTAVFVLSIIPQLLRLPSARSLQKEIDDHRITFSALHMARAALALRVEITEAELRHAEEDHALSDKLLRAVIEAVPGLIYAKDKAGRFLLANKCALELFGKPWGLVQGRTDAELLDDKRQAKTVMANDMLVMELGRQHGFEEIINHPGKGTRVWLSTKLPLLDASGAVSGVAGVSIDITDRKRLQAEFNQISRISAMGVMATALAHELNQPLGAINLYLEGIKTLVQPGIPPHPALRPIELAREQCLRAGEIIRRLRAFLSGGDRVRQPENLSRMVDDACELALLGSRENNVETLIKHDFPETTVVVDEIEIQQVIVNLVRNALESMPLHGNNRLVIRTGRDALWNAVVSVEDTGCGLTPEVRAGLFQAFKSSKGANGMGIGLSLCRTIIEAHGGTISGAGNPKIGSTFLFTLPTVAQDVLQ